MSVKRGQCIQYFLEWRERKILFFFFSIFSSSLHLVCVPFLLEGTDFWMKSNSSTSLTWNGESFFYWRSIHASLWLMYYQICERQLFLPLVTFFPFFILVFFFSKIERYQNPCVFYWGNWDPPNFNQMVNELTYIRASKINFFNSTLIYFVIKMNLEFKMK